MTPLANIRAILSYDAMASHAPHPEQIAGEAAAPLVVRAEHARVAGAPQQSAWRSIAGLSRAPACAERFLVRQGFERAPWLVVAFAFGIAAWFVLATWRERAALAALLPALACVVALALRRDGQYPYLRQALIATALMAAAGLGAVWLKSALLGALPITRPQVATITARVIGREVLPAENRVRLMVATREPGTGRAIQARLNVPAAADVPGLGPGAQIEVRARLVPPAPPMLPGGYDFAQTAWFAGLAATGSTLGAIRVVRPAGPPGWLSAASDGLSRHVRASVPGAAGAIIAAFVSGDQGAIPLADQNAMRDAGLSHLLSISGLHVSAVVGAGYVLVIRLAALWPWLALRVRLPVAAAGAGALAGIGYTLLTGSQVPTLRSCIGALLVLAALALGREALSLRMLATAAFLVLLLWPEALAGPSFELSFAAVIAIIALHSCAPMRRFLAARDEGRPARLLRWLATALITGAVVELALLPIGLYHFHRAGLYGTVANVVAIPLTEFVVMPLAAVALVLDIAGLGGPVWWLAGTAVNAMLVMAHWFSAQPGAVTMLPAMGRGSFALFIAGGLWLALWRGQPRLLGLPPVALATLMLALLRPPDLLVSGDGRHVGILDRSPRSGGGLVVLRAGRGGFTGATLAEMAGTRTAARLITDWPQARCGADFCTVILDRDAREWHLLIARGHDLVPTGALAAACSAADIVIADRRLPRACRPRVLKADRALLANTGGLAIDLAAARISTVAAMEGDHGWWPAGAAR